MPDDAAPTSSSTDEASPLRPVQTPAANAEREAAKTAPPTPDSVQPPPVEERRPPAERGPITLDRVVRFLLAAAAVGAVGWGLWYFAGLVLYLVVGGILAYLLRPVVDRVQGWGLGRVPAIFLTFLAVIGAIGIAVTSVVPFLAQQVQDLSQLVSVEAARDVATYLERQLRQVVPLEQGTLVRNVEQMATALVQGDLVRGDRVTQTLTSVVTVFTNIVYAVVIIPFVTFFLLKDGIQIRQRLLSLVPNRYFEVTLAILDKVEVNIGRYFRALLVQCTSIALIASFLLWLVGLQSAIAIGIFTGLANTIPYFGPFLGFLCGTLVGIAQTGNMALVPGVALAMALTQLADNVLLQPLIFSKAAKAHPLVILFVVLVGAQLAGIVGMLISIPLATTLRVVGEQLLWSLRNYRILRASS
ncbi:MAG: AI-2E family transporter [Salinibacter sp.]